MEIQPRLELHKVLCGPIQLVDEESLFLGTIEADAKVVTHISEAKDVHNTMRVVPHFTGIPREFTHLVGVRPPGIASDMHVPVGPVHVLEEGPVREDIHSGPSVNDDPQGREVTIALCELIGIISDKVFHASHQQLCRRDVRICGLLFGTVVGDVADFATVVTALVLHPTSTGPVITVAATQILIPDVCKSYAITSSIDQMNNIAWILFSVH